MSGGDCQPQSWLAASEYIITACWLACLEQPQQHFSKANVVHVQIHLPNLIINKTITVVAHFFWFLVHSVSMNIAIFTGFVGKTLYSECENKTAYHKLQIKHTDMTYDL